MSTHIRNTSRADQPLYVELLQGFTVRLIELEEGEPDSEISIRLLIAELDFAPQFEALSYVWGDSNDRLPITCNGRTISITSNLHKALRRTRYIDRPRILWVDAICINQRNNKECSYHVSFMNKIYNKAKRVLVYMGDDQDGRAADVQQLLKEHVDRIKPYPSIKNMPMVLPGDPIFQDNRWKAVATLMKNEWFTRAWVLQEVGVAKLPIVLYGQTEFKYRDLTNLTRWITICAQSLQSRADIFLVAIHTNWEDWSPNWRETSSYPEFELLDFLSHAKYLQCRRYHDRVYAYLGHPLLQNEDGSGPVIIPDYDLSEEQLDRQLTEFMLQRSGFRVVAVIEHDDSSLLEDRPSWVVRWGGVELVQQSFGCYVGFYYQASGDIKPDPLFRIDEDKFHVRGIVVDTIKCVHQFTTDCSDLEKPEALRNIDPGQPKEVSLDRAWRDVQGSAMPCRYSPEKKNDAFSLSLCGGLTGSLRAEDNMTKHNANFAAYWGLRQKATGEVVSENLVVQAEKGDADDFYWDMSLTCEGRVFFITEKGYYGLGPWIAKPGDICCVFLGANVPFILRPGQKSNEFKLVGESYTHGIMSGEALHTGVSEGVDVTLC
jgi:Heterokaryon incompatibility protein (HET)